MPQIKAHAFIFGVDSAFHMNRFYDTAMQIKTHQYSYFQSFFGFQQSGRVVNALYGPLFAYLNGMILLLAKTWYHYQIITSWLVLTISGSLMYRLAIKNWVKPIFSILIAVAYMMSDPVMAWIVGQQFTGWGAAFLPLALLMGTEMMREHKISVVKLAVVMALLFQIHVLTSLMAALALVPFFLVGLYLTNHRLKMMCNLLLSMGLTILLTANVWGGMLELSSSNNLMPVAPGINVSVTAPRIAGQSQAVVASAASVGTGSGLNTLGVTPLYMLIAVAVLVYLGLNLRKSTKSTWIIFLNGMVFLWMSTDYFPWTQIANAFPSVDYLQFPARFLAIALVLLLLAFGMCLSNQSKLIVVNLVKICFIGFVLISFNQSAYLSLQNGINTYRSNQVVLPDRNLTINPSMKPDRIRQLFNTNDLSKAVNAFNKPTPDYLPFFTKIRPDQYWIYHPYHLYKAQILTNLQPVNKSQVQPVKKKVSGDALKVTWTNPLNHKWWISIPVIKYAHTKVLINGKAVKVDTSTIGKLFIDSKPGINHATIVYQSSRWFNALVLLMIVSWVALIVGFIFNKIRFNVRSINKI
ncbi:hypothetical protein [Nicoliella lavandulae]|uniref:Membrane protein 6-pyruvoyl-tetrahydropterin synthase-related domain-containing protein n=1 Tax=Nicoliella lavandulae TaxID=3082954 RepID=A0ABU8SPM5_9LACO